MRDMVGYGRTTPNFLWPNGAKIAVNFVINYEEGSERTPLLGDSISETYGCEFALSEKPKGVRHFSVESLFEYGSRCGIWRLVRLFDEEQIPLTFFASGLALEYNSAFCDYLKGSHHEIAGHGWRWIDYAHLSRQDEKKHIETCVATIENKTNQTPLGWYTGRTSQNTRSLLQEIGGFVYNSDSYADDLPYTLDNQLIIPYNLDCNDFRFTTTPGFSTADQFLQHLKNTFDYLHYENRLSLMTIGLHPRISGRPGRCIAIKQFIDHLKASPNVWITKRINIAKHWLEPKHEAPSLTPEQTLMNTSN